MTVYSCDPQLLWKACCGYAFELEAEFIRAGKVRWT